jgi:hypothetical protein
VIRVNGGPVFHGEISLVSGGLAIKQSTDRVGISRHLKALADGLAEPLQHRCGQGLDGGVQLADRGWIEGRQAGIEG